MRLTPTRTPTSAVDLTQDIAAYEAIWMQYSTFTKVSNVFRQFNYALPSQVAQRIGIPAHNIENVALTVAALLPFDRFQVVFHHNEAYPSRLNDAKHPIEAFYYQGALTLLASKSVAIIGSRNATATGIRRAQKLARFLVAHQITVMSGLARGIDTAAHTAALDAGEHSQYLIRRLRDLFESMRVC